MSDENVESYSASLQVLYDLKDNNKDDLNGSLYADSATLAKR